MTQRLAHAARNARYLFQVYGVFGKPMPLALAEMVSRDLVEALEEYDGVTEADIEVDRAERRYNARERREQRERCGRGLPNPEAYDPSMEVSDTEGPFMLWGSDRGGRL